MNKIIRTICYFTQKPSRDNLVRLNLLAQKLMENGFSVQTKRLTTPFSELENLDELSGNEILFSVGSVPFGEVKTNLEKILESKLNISFNIDLSLENITNDHIDFLFKIISKYPRKTFNFTYVFNNSNPTPFFPSSNYIKDGFAVGLQPTNLAENCNNLDEWFQNMTKVWEEINQIFSDESDFLGIDTSIAPLFKGESSLINFIKRIVPSFNDSVLDTKYLQTTNFIKKYPKAVGLCGLMFPCLEDFELAEEYEKGNFAIERNIFLSLHSGLGIDTYPIGIDESKEQAAKILKVVQGLSNKYHKPLSVRFVSDGKAKIGEKTDFKNQYLKDVIIRKLC